MSILAILVSASRVWLSPSARRNEVSGICPLLSLFLSVFELMKAMLRSWFEISWEMLLALLLKGMVRLRFYSRSSLSES